MKTSIGFSIYLNGKLIREVSFDRPIINVGKLSTSNLRLDDINVSRKHAVIEQRESGDWRITDLGSTNGTIVGGERQVQADLHDGDRLVLGTTTLIVHLDDAAVAKVSRAEAGMDKKRSGVAGDVKATEDDPDSRPVEEIRGLGEDSFFKRRQVGEAQVDNALEVALLWGETVLAVETFATPQTITIGEAQGCRFTVPQEILGGKRYDLITATKDGRFALSLGNPNITGDVLVGGQVKSLQALAEERGDTSVPMDEPMRARLKIGQFTLLVTYGAIPTRTGIRAIGEVDYDAWIYIAISAIVHIAFLLVLSYLPEDMLLSQRDPRAMRERAIQVLRVEPKEEEEEKKPEEDKEEEDKANADAAKTEEDKLKASETQVVDAPPVERPSKIIDHLTMKRNKEREAFETMSAEERRKRAKELSQMTALNDAFRNDNPLFNELLNTNPDLDNTPSRFKALTSRADPNAPASSFTAGAIDPFGGTLGSTGGGFQTADGGVGGPGGPGRPGGPAIAGVLDGHGRRRNLNDLKFNERPAEPKIIQMKPRLTGELDAKTVQQYIRRYLSGIKWCYQDRLQRNRRLGGKLTLAFTILPNGHVLDPQTRNSTVRDADLEACIVKKMSRWKFPSPKDGGLVQVAYPLILKTQ